MTARVGAATEPLATTTGVPHDLLADFILEYSGGALQLRDTRPGAPGPIRADLHSQGAIRRKRAGRGLLLARACGIRKGKPLPDIIDATAGLGADAYTLAALGCKVTAIECNPAVFALLADGLKRTVNDIGAANISALRGDATLMLGDLPRAEVVYLDPMFPDTGRTALSRKEMQYFQAIVEPGNDAELFLAALDTGAKRVVVKRPKVAPPLAPGRKPDVVFRGESVRFDVYLQ